MTNPAAVGIEKSIEIVFGPHIRFRQIIESMKDLVINALFICSSDNIRVFGANTGNRCRCFIDLQFTSKCCRRYILPSTSPSATPQIFGVKVDELITALHWSKKKDNNAIVLVANPEQTSSFGTLGTLSVTFVNDETGHKSTTLPAPCLPLLSPAEVKLLYPLPLLPSLAESSSFVLPSQEFKRMCLELTIIGAVVEFALYRDRLEVQSGQSPDSYGTYIIRDNSANAKKNDQPVCITMQQHHSEPLVQSYVLRFLNFFAKPAQLKPVYELTQQVVIGMTPSQPLTVRYSLENVGQICFYLDPKSAAEESKKIGTEGIFTSL